jgi:hypothetical protein
MTELTEGKEHKPDDQDDETDRRQNADLQKNGQDYENQATDNHGAPPLRGVLPRNRESHAACRAMPAHVPSRSTLQNSFPPSAPRLRLELGPTS